MGAVSSAQCRTRATLDAWRERGADRLNPIRFHVIEAMHRRSATQTGEARRILDARLADLMSAYADELERATSRSGAVEGAMVSSEPPRSALAGLVEHIARQAPGGRGTGLAASHATIRPRAYAGPDILDDFRETWSRLSTEKQLRQSLEQVPTNAGPLNSSSLVHRSLSLMRELSPEYLRQFLSYVDSLSWLEQMAAGSALASDEAARTASARKSARSRLR